MPKGRDALDMPHAKDLPGVWGGTTPDVRRRMLRERAA